MFLLIQLYLLFDCSDGELARYTGRFSAAGVYLDRMGHYIAEALLLAGLGVRAQGHFSLSGGYVSAGLAAAICATLIKAETDSVDRGPGVLGPGRQARRRGARAPVAGPRRWPGGWRRRCACTGSSRPSSSPCSSWSPRIVDAVAGDLTATRVLTIAALVVGVADGGRAPGGHRRVPEARMTVTAQRTLTLSCVILTMGNRPAEVVRAIDSVLAQTVGTGGPRSSWSWWATAPR